MKILAIRGANLTSLASPFEVCLEGEPLRSAGLFAITGPTGSGKSSILDAMCLALYDCTPRVKGRVGVVVGREDEDERLRLRSSDPKSLVRRGANDAFAEVDFLGRDGSRYRATWSVRRARTGKLSEQAVSLVDLGSGQPCNGTRTEVLNEIQSRLGLSFDQFCRSALLAQGEFAAFLKANDTERAELLECMTGTGIYGHLSIKAHERQVAERQALETLEGRLGDVKVLSDEERAAAELALQEASGRVGRLEGEARVAESAQRWYQELRTRLEQEREAQAAFDRAREAVAGAEPLRGELARVEGAQALRPVVDGWDQRTRDAQQAAALAEERRQAADAAAHGLAAAARAVDHTNAALVAQQQRREGLQGELGEAAELDVKVSEAGKRAAEAADAAVKARAGASEADREHGLKERVLKQCEKRQAEAIAWLDAHQHLAPLAQDWGLWKSELARYSRSSAAVKDVTATLAGLEKSVQDGAAALSAAREAEEAARRALEERQAAAAAAEIEARKQSVDELREKRVALEEHLDVLRTLAEAAQAARDAFQQERELQEQQRAATREAEAASQQAVAAAEAIVRLEAAHSEANRALDAARSRQALAERRGELRDGEPCPLCGAVEHPYAHDAAPMDALIEEQQDRVAELERERRQALESKARAEERRTSLARVAEDAARNAEARLRERQARQGTWDQVTARVTVAELPKSAHDDGAVTSVQSLVAGVRHQLADLVERERAVARLVEAASGAREAVEPARVAWEAGRERVAAAEKALEQARKLLDDAQATLRREETTCREAVQALAAPCAAIEGWPARFTADPSAFASRLEKDVSQHKGYTDNAGKLEKSTQEARKEADVARRERDLKEKAAVELEDERRKREEDLEGLVIARKGRLGGRPTDEVRRELEQAVRQAETALQDAQKAHQEGALAAARAATDAASAEQQRDTATSQRDEARRTLDAVLAEHGLDEASLRALLARDDAWRAERRAHLERLTKQHDACRTILEERRQRRSEHEATHSPALPEEQVGAALEQARSALQQAQEEAGGLRVRLEVDDQARRTTSEIAGRMEEQRRRWEVWKALSDLIGSADGKKFRKFAQSLTLDVLLGHANHQLVELAPRYRLQRVPGHDLDLQVVDLEMGDEVRSIQSLSGGESFLVSLALALGLSSLASDTTRVGSLFIDEGFGSLDTQSLEQALASLDALQASGRQVGLISHMAGVSERIGVQVRVSPLGGGRSKVETVTA